MSQSIISVEGLGKRYTLGERAAYGSLRESLVHAAGAPRRWASARRRGESTGGERANHFWAIRDVSFEVGEGEVVGLIGGNGAGKSTTLKLLSRITRPTEGRAVLRGRVGSLLEVGTGFHPELTGRENIFLNGVLLGLSKADVRRRFDEIVEFSGVERFLDTPVKRYSSGMFVRLGFAVAAHLDCEILIVDEVLAVGDLAFQQKCLGKMSDVAQQGRTVLFVSHNMTAMQRLCHRALLFDRGRMVKAGETSEIIAAYVSTAVSHTGPGRWIDVDEWARVGNGAARVRAVRYQNATVDDTPLLYAGDAVDVEYIIDAESRLPVSDIAVTIFDQTGTKLVNASTLALDEIVVLEPGLNTFSVRIHGLNLNSGRYNLGWWLAGPLETLFDQNTTAFPIEVLDSPRLPYGTRDEGNGHVLTDFSYSLATEPIDYDSMAAASLAGATSRS